MSPRILLSALLAIPLIACGDGDGSDAGLAFDAVVAPDAEASGRDAGPDAGRADAGRADAQPTPDAQPGADARPPMDAGPGMDAEPAIDAEPGMDAEPAVDAAPAMDAAPGADAVPAIDAQPNPDAAPAADAAAPDADPPDAGAPDTGEAPDAEPTDSGLPASFTDVYAIIQANCGCHLAAPGPQGLNMSTRQLAYSNLVGAATGSAGPCAGNTRVIAGDAANSVLYRKVSGINLCGERMPRFGPSLPAEQVDAIGSWIAAGALDN